MWRKNHILGSYSPVERPEKTQQENIELVSRNLQGSGLGRGCGAAGIGKIAACLLSILHRLTKGPLRQVRALIVAPTRELAEQTHQIER